MPLPRASLLTLLPVLTLAWSCADTPADHDASALESESGTLLDLGTPAPRLDGGDLDAGALETGSADAELDGRQGRDAELSDSADASAGTDALAPDATAPDATASDATAPDATAPDATAPDGRAIVPPMFVCTVTTAVLAPRSARAGYRPDFFYPYGPGIADAQAFGTDTSPTYPEARIQDPATGGRHTVIAQAAVAGSLLPDRVASGGSDRAAFQVEIDGSRGADLLDAGDIDWVRVWPPAFNAGQPIWVMFHSRQARFGGSGTFQLRVPTSAGDAISELVSFGGSPLALESVTASDDGRSLLVHVHNESSAPQHIIRLIAQGLDATPYTCPDALDLAPGESRQLRAQLPAPLALGQPWTIAVDVVGAPPAVGAGRVDRPHFAVHAWPKEADCPFPGINDASFGAMLAQGFDTLFARSWYGGPGCSGRSTIEAIQQDLGPRGAFAMADDSGIRFLDPSRVRARLLGDEVDDHSTAQLASEQKMRQIAEATTYWSVNEPTVPTYIGGSRSRHSGMFAGAADLQGMDFYVAGCAPHVTDFGRHPPLRAAYDYLRAAQRNQRPLGTWLYTQGMGNWRAQPSPAEYRVQALSVLAAGAHGLMTFQSDLDEAQRSTDLWRAMGALNRDVAALGPWLRECAPTGAARVLLGRAIVEALRIPGGMIVVVIGLETTAGPSDVLCGVGVARHWAMAQQTVDVELDVPADMGVRGVLELRDGVLTDLSSAASARGRTLAISGIQLDEASVGRLFLIADDPGLPAAVQQRL